MKQFSILALCLVGMFFIVDASVEAQALMAGDEMFIEMLKQDVDQARIEVMASVMGF